MIPKELVIQTPTSAYSAHELKLTPIAHKVQFHPTVTLQQLQRQETTALHPNVPYLPQSRCPPQIVTPGRCVMPWSLEPAHLLLVLLRTKRPIAQRWYVIP